MTTRSFAVALCLAISAALLAPVVFGQAGPAVTATAAPAAATQAATAPASQAATQSTSQPAVPVVHLPLVAYEAHAFATHTMKEPKQPLVQVGVSMAELGGHEPVRPKDYYIGVPMTKTHALLDGIADGKSPLAPPDESSNVLVVLAGPSLDSGEYFAPVSLTRQGNAFTLRADCWRDDGPRLRNIPQTSMYVLSLGKLAAKPYELRVEVRQMFRKSAAKVPYEWTETQTGTLRFTVLKAGSEGGETPKLELADLKKQDPPAEAKGCYYLVPHVVAWSLAAKAGPALKADAYDVPAFLNGSARSLDALKLAPAGPRQYLITALVAPACDIGEWASLREIVWKDNVITLTTDVWKDRRELNMEHIRCPLLFTFMDSYGKTGKADVKGKFQVLMGDELGRMYVRDAERDFAVGPVAVEFVENGGRAASQPAKTED